MGPLIKKKIDLLAECIFAKIQKSEKNESFGVYSGQFGLLLFLLYYSRYSQNEKHALVTEKYAEELLDLFAVKEKSHTFCSGFAGILYLFEFLNENRIINLDVSNIQLILDNYLAKRMRLDINQRIFDFMHGAMGVGLYFLKRKTNPEYIQELVDFLYKTAEKDNDNQTFKWESVVDYENNLIGYNFSLCHGISSIIVFLSRVVENGMSNEKVQEMLFNAVNFLLSQQKDVSQFGSFFPSMLIKNSSVPIQKSRLAWCYGDLGNGIVLRQAGKALKKPDLEKRGLEVLIHSTFRRSSHETSVIDAGICHGSAGIAMIFRRMFFETQRDEFKQAISYWINQTLNFSRFEDGLVGYKTLRKDQWECDYSLLTGISGIGLVLLSYIDDNQQDWDELFLIS